MRILKRMLQNYSIVLTKGFLVSDSWCRWIKTTFYIDKVYTKAVTVSSFSIKCFMEYLIRRRCSSSSCVGSRTLYRKFWMKKSQCRHASRDGISSQVFLMYLRWLLWPNWSSFLWRLLTNLWIYNVFDEIFG